MVSHLTVIDPRHGLAGQRLELVSSRFARGPAFVVVRLPDGRRRSIRRSVTDLAAASPEEQGVSKSLARINVRTLLILLHHLNSTLASRIEEVIRDEHTVESVPRSVPDPHRTSQPGHGDTPEPLAQLAGGDAEADRAEPRATSLADAIDGRADSGGSAC
ncbi:Y4bD/Y4pK family protein [Mesorhizobium sp. M0854]